VIRLKCIVLGLNLILKYVLANNCVMTNTGANNRFQLLHEVSILNIFMTVA